MSTEPELRRRLRLAEERLHRLENVRPPDSPHVRDLADTKANKATDGQVLAYEKATGLWKPTSAGGGGGLRSAVFTNFSYQVPPRSTGVQQVKDYDTSTFNGSPFMTAFLVAGYFEFNEAGTYLVNANARWENVDQGVWSIRGDMTALEGATATLPAGVTADLFLSYSYVRNAIAFDQEVIYADNRGVAAVNETLSYIQLSVTKLS